MQLTFSDGSHFLNPQEIAAAYRRGVGALEDAGTIAATAAQGAAVTGSILASLTPALAMAGPIGAAVAGLTAVGLAISNLFSGCGQTCIAATQIDNQVEPILLQNLQHYMAASPRYRSIQQAALNNFDTMWAAYVKAEQSVPTQGAISIQERGPSGCHEEWKAPDGSCWNWYTGYRNPIANDPTVVPDPSPSGDISAAIFGSGSSVSGGSGPSIAPLLLLGGAAIVAMMVLD